MKTSILRWFSKVALVLPLSLAACSPSARLVPPAGFAHIEGDYDDRISSARGVVVGVRSLPNEPRANLGFWTEAIDLRLKQRGYAVKSGPVQVKSKSGLVGQGLRYEYGTRKYWVDIYVTDTRILLVEATGRAQDLDASADAVTSAMRDVGGTGS